MSNGTWVHVSAKSQCFCCNSYCCMSVEIVVILIQLFGAHHICWLYHITILRNYELTIVLHYNIKFCSFDHLLQELHWVQLLFMFGHLMNIDLLVLWSWWILLNCAGCSSTYYLLMPNFLCRLRSIATHRDHFVRRLSVCPSVCLSIRLSVRPSVTLAELCFACDTCIPRNAATIFGYYALIVLLWEDFSFSYEFTQK